MSSWELPLGKCGKELIEYRPRGLSDTLPHGGENDG